MFHGHLVRGAQYCPFPFLMDSGSGACRQLSVRPGSSSYSSPSDLCPPTTPQIPLHTLIFLSWIPLVFYFVQSLL